MVVWVQAWAWRARPSAGRVSQNSPMRSGSSNGPVNSAGSPMPSTKRRHASWMSAGVSCSASRRTTSAAFTKALSVRRGCEACPGVPRTVMVHQKAPFSPVMTGQADPAGARHGEAARLGDEVVAADLVGHVLGQPLRAVAAEGLLVGDADEQAGRPRGGTPRRPGGARPRPWTP